MRHKFDVFSLFAREKYFYSPLQSSKTGNSNRTCSNLLGILALLCVITASFTAGRHSVTDNSLLNIPRESLLGNVSTALLKHTT